VAFITDPELTKACKSANTHASNPLPAHWEDAVPRANRWAYNRIRGVILARGFTAAQFAAWGESGEEGRDWNERVGVLYAFWLASKSDDDRGRAYADELKEAVEELKTLPIVIAGELVSPTGSGTRVGYGDFDTGADRFLLAESDGEGRFESTGGTEL
jgi:hypothetical protein